MHRFITRTMQEGEEWNTPEKVPSIAQVKERNPAYFWQQSSTFSYVFIHIIVSAFELYVIVSPSAHP